MKRKEENILRLYLLICFAIPGILFFVNTMNVGSAKITHFVTNLIPGFAVAFLYLVFYRKSYNWVHELGIQLKGITYWIVAPLFISVLSFIGFGALIVLFPDLVKSKDAILFSLDNYGIYSENIVVGLIINGVIYTLLGSLVNIPFFIAQELGWRAYMQKKLLVRWKPLQAYVLAGGIWGLWTVLFVIPSYPFLDLSIPEVILTIIFCIATSTLFYFFYERSQSIFVSAFAHAALFKSFETIGVVIRLEKINEIHHPFILVFLIVTFGSTAILLLRMDYLKNKKYRNNLKSNTNET